MAFPVNTKTNNLTGSFGPRQPIKLLNGGWSGGYHYGMDFAPEQRGMHNAVYAYKGGTVTSVGYRSDAGRYVIVYIPSKRIWIRYCHLSSYSVGAGQSVQEAQFLGRMGATGNVNGVHLHFEIYTDSGLSRRVNPYDYIWYEKNPADFAINGGKASAPVTKPGSGETFSTIGHLPWITVKNGRDYYLADHAGRETRIMAPDHITMLQAGINAWKSNRSAGRSTFTLTGTTGDIFKFYLHRLHQDTPSPAPAPKPAPVRDTVVIGSTLRLRNWVGYTTSTLWGRQPALLNGDFRVVGISHGNFRVQGNGRDAWVDGPLASAGLI